MEKECEHCESEFTAKRKDVVYCSASCRQMAYMERKLHLLRNDANIGYIPLQDDEPETSTQVSIIPLETSIDSTIDREETLSVNTEPQLIATGKPSIDVLKQPLDTSINIPTKKVEDRKYSQAKTEERPQEKEYEEATVKTLNTIREFIEDRNCVLLLGLCNINSDISPYWVGTRLKCLTECLLTFSEMKCTSLNDLKEICNAFTQIIGSTYFTGLSARFPYEEMLRTWRDKLKKFCIEYHGNKEVVFRLTQTHRMELIATRYELSHFIPKQSFSKLNFEE